MNLFGITSLMIFCSSIAFGLLVYSNNRKSRSSKAWFLASGSIGAWGLCLWGVTSAETAKTALYWQYGLDVFAIMIPVLYYRFVALFLNKYHRRFFILSFVLALVIATISFSSLFKTGVEILYGVYWITPGKLYNIFPVYFFVYTVISLVTMAQAYMTEGISPLLKSQIRNTFLAGLIGFGGGLTNFFPQLFNVYPFGNYFVLLYLFIMTYGVLRYQLLGAKVLSAQIFSGAIVLVFFFNVLIPSESFIDLVIKILLLGLVSFFSIFLVKSVFREVETRQKIQKLADDLEVANEKLKELDKLKSEFLSIASHQIRAPITAIKGYASLILEGDFGPISKEVHDAVDVIANSSNNMAVTVDDFLNISRIEQGRMKYDFVDIDLLKLVTDVYNEQKPNVEKKGLTFTLNAVNALSFMAHVDAGKIKQVLTNLIDNSIKYTPKGSIVVSLERLNPQKKFIIRIKDTGIGVPKDMIDKLFQKFSRAKGGISENVTGTGLGLYVVKQMVEAHGGRVWVESEGEGKGSSFNVELNAK